MKKYFIIYILGVLILSSAGAAHAQVPGLPGGTNSGTGFGNTSGQPSQYTLLEPLPDLQHSGQTVSTVDFKGYVQYAYNLVIALAAAAAVFMIVWGGFEYMTVGSFSGKSNAIKKVQNAIYGLLLILCSYLILRTIDPRLVEIPNTFVPQLNLQYAKGDFFSPLSDSINVDKYGAQASQLRNTVNNARSGSAVYQDQLDQVNEEYAKAEADGDTEKLYSLQGEAEELESKIQQQESIAASAVKQADMALVLGQASLATPEQLKSGTYLSGLSSNIEKEHAAGIAQLQAISNPPDPEQKQKLDDAYNYAKGIIAIQQDINDSKTGFRNIVGGYVGAVQNAATSPSGIFPGNLPDIIYKGFDKGYGAVSDQKLAESIGTDVIHGSADQIKDPALKAQLYQAANDAITKKK